MSREDNVCVAIVTYNRKDLLIRLLKRLLVISPNTIVILDNNSSDGTFESLAENGFIDEGREVTGISKTIKDDVCIIYKKNKVNEGGAGGFCKSIEVAKETNCKYIWVMDDDVLPEIDCLDKLLDIIKSREISVAIPNRSDNSYSDSATIRFNLSNILLINQKRKKIITEPDENCIIEDMPFEGPLIKKEVVEKIGLPDKNYFLFYDDSDYAQRCQSVGKIIFCTNAILHKQIIPIDKKDEYDFNWRDYYFYRNSMYFEKKYGRNILVRNISPHLTYLAAVIKSIMKNKKKNLLILKRAHRDYMQGKMGKTIEPNSI